MALIGVALWASDAESRVFVYSSMDRVFRSGKTLATPTVTAEAKVRLAKNEYESFQVVVRGEAAPLAAVELVVSDFTHTTSAAVLNPQSISWRVVGYVPTAKPYYKVKFVGDWPDPLLPAKPVDVAAGQVQPFWVTVYASPETPSGVYKGKVLVKSSEELLKEIPVEIEVMDFQLPKESSLKTAFDFYGHIMDARYPQGLDETKGQYEARLEELREKFIIMMLQYRMNPILNIDPQSQADLDRVGRYREYGLNNFSIGKKGGTFGNNWPESDEELEALLPLYRAYGEKLAANKLLGFHYIYSWDEEGDVGFPRVAQVTSMIHRADPRLRNMTCFHGVWDPDQNSDWGKDIDIWCAQISDYDQAKIQKLKDRGVEAWIYASGPSDDGTPNLAMDFDSIDYRIIPWMNWKFKIDGFLYWCVNWWVKVDPFQSAANTKWAQNGNGLLFYPGEDGPIASLRAEIFRDGLEDYEYLVYLNTLAGKMKEKGLDKNSKSFYDAVIQLLKIDSSLISSLRSYQKDPQKLLKRRDWIAGAIVKLEQLLKPALPAGRE